MMSCKQEEPRPTCSKAAASSEAPTDKLTCPVCVWLLKQLRQHVCPDADEQDTPVNPLRNSDQVQTPNVSTGPVSIERTTGKQLCSVCVGVLGELRRHKCPDADDKDGQTCLTCRTCIALLKKLRQHECPDEGAQSSVHIQSQENPARNSAAPAHRAGHAQEPCPAGGNSFKMKQPPGASGDIPSEDGSHKTSPTSEVSSQSQPVSLDASGQALQDSCQLKQEIHGVSAAASLTDMPVSAFVPKYPDPVIDIGVMEEKIQWLKDRLSLRASSNPRSKFDAFFKEELQVKRGEARDALYAFTKMRNKLIVQLEETIPPLHWDFLHTGSSYDGTKVTRADEVDCMFVPLAVRKGFTICREGAPEGFCFLQLNPDVSLDDDPSSKFLLSLRDHHQNRLSSEAFRDKVFDVFKKVVDSERHAKVDPNPKPGSPALTVTLEVNPKQGAGPGLRPISVDLVPALRLDKWPQGSDWNLRGFSQKDADFIRQAGCHVVPKACPQEGYESVNHLLWRFSFSAAEKRLTQYAESRFEPPSPAQAPTSTPAPPPAPTQAPTPTLTPSPPSAPILTQAPTSTPPPSPPSAPILTQAPSPTPAQKTSVNTCRKELLRFFKRLLEIFKGVDNSRTLKPTAKELIKVVDCLREDDRYKDLKVEKFTTYQIRTLMWTEFYLNQTGDNNWDKNHLRSHMIRCSDQLIDMVCGRIKVFNFFIRDLDTMSEVSELEKEFLYILFCVAKFLF